MGKRNPERVPVWMRYSRAVTVLEMMDQKWDVISKCTTCGLMMQTDLRLIARVSGPLTSLWDRVGRCRRIGCGGPVQFHGRAQDMSWHERLEIREAPEPGWMDRHLAELAARRKIRREDTL